MSYGYLAVVALISLTTSLPHVVAQDTDKKATERRTSDRVDRPATFSQKRTRTRKTNTVDRRAGDDRVDIKSEIARLTKEVDRLAAELKPSISAEDKIHVQREMERIRREIDQRVFRLSRMERDATKRRTLDRRETGVDSKQTTSELTRRRTETDRPVRQRDLETAKRRASTDRPNVLRSRQPGTDRARLPIASNNARSSDRPQSNPNDLERRKWISRIEHLEQAHQHLRAAGLNEMSDQLVAQIHEMQNHLRNLDREQKDQKFHSIEKKIDDLANQLSRLRREIQQLKD